MDDLDRLPFETVRPEDPTTPMRLSLSEVLIEAPNIAGRLAIDRVLDGKRLWHNGLVCCAEAANWS